MLCFAFILFSFSLVIFQNCMLRALFFLFYSYILLFIIHFYHVPLLVIEYYSYFLPTLFHPSLFFLYPPSSHSSSFSHPSFPFSILTSIPISLPFHTYFSSRSIFFLSLSFPPCQPSYPSLPFPSCPPFFLRLLQET